MLLICSFLAGLQLHIRRTRPSHLVPSRLNQRMPGAKASALDADYREGSAQRTSIQLVAEIFLRLASREG